MIVAGLDVATMTGVCLGEPGQAPAFFSRDLGRVLPHQERGANIMRLTHELIKDHGVQFIGIEAPVQARTNKKEVNELLMGLIFNVRSWAALQGVKSQCVEIGSLDKHFLGRGGMARTARKAANLARCHSLGWRPGTEDEADAGSVWDYACSLQCRSHSIHSTPLFQGRA